MTPLPVQLEGVKVFPVQPGGKLPATTTGWREASNDPTQIERWKRVNPDFNWAVACGLSELFVIDVDPAGLDYWAKLLERDAVIRAAVARAFQVRTPRGGLHIYFRGEGPSTASRIAEGIDTRGGMMKAGKLVSGGYVLLPGSRTKDGIYEALPGGVVDALPACIAGIVPERNQKDVLGLSKEPDKDLPRNVQTAMDLIKGYVAAGSVAIEGKGGDNLTIATATSILSKGISREKCFDLLWEHWNPLCSPPWDEWELELKIQNAWASGTNTQTGAEGHQSNIDAFAAFLGMETPSLEAGKPARKKLMRIDEYADSVGDPEWLLPGVLPRQGVGVIYGDSGSYKSFIAMDLGLTLAFGIPGQWENSSTDKQSVLFFAGEAPNGMARLRFPAWMLHHDQEFRSDHGLLFQDRVPFHEDIEEWEDIKQMLGEIKKRPSLIVIDTLSRLMTHMAENESSDAKVIMSFLDNLARYYDCFILVVHHTGKDQNKGARGSNVYVSNADTVMQTRKMENGCSLQMQKHKDADTEANFRYFEKKVYDLGENKKGEPINSIVLALTKNKPAELGKKKPVVSWATQVEVCAILTEKLNGSAQIGTLAQEIHLKYDVDLQKVKNILNSADELKFLHDGNTWSLPDPGEKENDG